MQTVNKKSDQSHKNGDVSMLRILTKSKNLLLTILSFLSDFVTYLSDSLGKLRRLGRNYDYPYRVTKMVDKGFWKIEKYNPGTNKHIYLLGGYTSEKDARKHLALFVKDKDQGNDY